MVGADLLASSEGGRDRNANKKRIGLESNLETMKVFGNELESQFGDDESAGRLPDAGVAFNEIEKKQKPDTQESNPSPSLNIREH